jgi:hypothetical protein
MMMSMVNANRELHRQYEKLNEALDRTLAGAEGRHESLASVLLDIQAEMASRLDFLSLEDFPKAWILYVLTGDLLKYSIEDDYVDVNVLRPALQSLSKLLLREDWIDADLYKCIQIGSEVGKQRPLEPIHVSVSGKNAVDREAIFKAWIANPDQPIPVSSSFQKLIPILELNVADPEWVQGVVNGFESYLRRLRDKDGITHLCFVWKEAGPVGAISMLSSLVERVKLPACIYRLGYWSRRSRVTGSLPQAGDRVAIVYDLLVTGDGVRRIAENLKKDMEVTVAGAVVLLGYGERKDTLEVDGQVIKVHAFDWCDAERALAPLSHAGEHGLLPRIWKEK